MSEPTDIQPEANRLTIAGASQSVKSLAVVAIIGISGFAALLVVLHILRPEYDPLQRYISEYGVGPYSYLMQIAFLTIGLGSVALAGALSRGLKTIIGARPPQLIGAWGMGMALLAVFATNLKDHPKTLVGRIHDNISIINLICLLVGMELMARPLQRYANWRWFNPPALAYALGGMAAVLKITLWLPIGLAERLLTVVLLTWLFLASFTLYRSVQN